MPGARFFAMVIAVLVPVGTWATTPVPEQFDQAHTLRIQLGQSIPLKLPYGFIKAEAHDESGVEVRCEPGAKECRLVGDALCQTRVHVWMEDDHHEFYRVDVVESPERLLTMVTAMLKGIAGVKVHRVAESLFFEGVALTNDDNRIVQAVLNQFPEIQNVTVACGPPHRQLLEVHGWRRLPVVDVTSATSEHPEVAGVRFESGVATISAHAVGETKIHVSSANHRTETFELMVDRLDPRRVVSWLKRLTAGLPEYSFEVRDGRVYVSGSSESAHDRRRIKAVLREFSSVIDITDPC